MSSLNGFNGQQGRPVARPAADQPQTASNGHQQPALGQQAWQPQGHYQQQPAAHQWAPPAAQPGYPQQGYGQGGYPAAPEYGQQAQQPSYGGLSSNPDAYAPSFEPYSPVANPRTAPAAHQPVAAGYPAQGVAPEYGAQPGYGGHDPRTQTGYALQHPSAQQWPANPISAQQAYRNADPRHHNAEPAFQDWTQSQAAQGYDYGDAAGHHQGQHLGAHDEMGFAQPAGGELEQGYAEEDGEEYEYEEPSRGRRPLMIAAALAGAIFVGGGMAYGYKAFLGGGSSGNPPMVKSASEPSKIKPADAGGKQFAHTDSKIMGRLGEGAAAGDAAASSGELDANGSRKVSTLVVGRDGSIQAPAASPAEPAAAAEPSTSVGVPGMMVVDALGPRSTAAAPPPMSPPVGSAASSAPSAQKLVVTPPAPPQKPVQIAKASAASDTEPALPDSTGSIASAAAAPAAPAKPVVKKVAAAKPEVVNDAFSTSAPVASAPVTAAAPTGANGYVAVLASVPRSDSSRMTALKKFADMQQKYGSVLTGKTPDVAEANLGDKGAYHRLVVGPPASRQQAATLCTELKAQGYADCWVTAY